MKILDIPRSGSFASITSSHNRAGQYVRNRRAPVQPVGTGRRGIIKSLFGSAAKYYASLTSAQQNAWIAYANAYPITDSLGQAITLTGHQMQIKINAALKNAGGAFSAVPPISNAVAAPVFSVFTVTHLGVITVTLTPSGVAADYILIAFSAPQSSGCSFCKTFWQQLVVPGNSVGAATYGTAYVAQFGLPPTGTRVFMKLTPVNQYGVTGPANIAFAASS